MANQEFFVAKKAAAVLKHGILSRYVLPFVTKTGTTSKDGRVVVLDGYAGEGRYEDGTPGSPIFMTESARQVAPPRRMELLFVEAKLARFNKLNQILKDEAPDVKWTALNGSVESHLDGILEEADGVPFFGFLDPCGLGLTFDDIVNKIYARPQAQFGPGTEILVNFSAEAVRRIGGRLREAEDAQGRERTLARMDAVCGGDWWRQSYLSAQTPAIAAEAIASGYFKRLTKATGAAGWSIAVRNAAHQQPKYTLVFLTRHRDGLWLFGEAASLSQADWRKALIPPDSLFSSDNYFKEAEAALKIAWIRQISANIVAILADTDHFIVSQRYKDVMGDLLGQPRALHIREALKQLRKEGVITSEVKGDLQHYRVIRAP